MDDRQTSSVLALLLAVTLLLGAGAGAVAGHRVPQEVVVTSATVPPSSGVADVVPSSVADVVDHLRPSVVAVHATVEAGDDMPGTLTAEATGTGFVIRSDGLIATAAHVIAGAWTLSVGLPTGESVGATVVGVDLATDLAVLEVDRDDLQPVVFGHTLQLRVGEPVIAIGHALDLRGEPTVSVGVLSAVERSVAGEGDRVYDHLLQTDAAINTGDSGGPLVSAAGEVIGINTSKITTGDAEGIGFAICTDHAVPALNRLAEKRN